MARAVRTGSGTTVVNRHHHVADGAVEHGAAYLADGAVAARSARFEYTGQSGSADRRGAETDHARGNPLGGQPSDGARVGRRGGPTARGGRFPVDRRALTRLPAIRARGRQVVRGFESRTL